MDQVLQTMIGSEMLSMLGGFFRYNQVEVRKEEQYKTTFNTPWGNFSYHIMHFGLIKYQFHISKSNELGFSGRDG
jgi:hypothetical protein